MIEDFKKILKEEILHKIAKGVLQEVMDGLMKGDKGTSNIGTPPDEKSKPARTTRKTTRGKTNEAAKSTPNPTEDVPDVKFDDFFDALLKFSGESDANRLVVIEVCSKVVGQDKVRIRDISDPAQMKEILDALKLP